MKDRQIPWLAIAATAVGNYLLARLGLMFSATSLGASPFWPAIGFIQAMILLYGYRCWPGIALGIFPAMLSIGVPWGVALHIAVGDTLGTLLPAYLLFRYTRFDRTLPNAASYLSFLVFMGLLSSAFGAAAGVTSFWLWGDLPGSQLAVAWLNWFVGDVLGSVQLGVPLLVWLGRPFPRKLGWPTAAQLGSLIAAVLAFGAVVLWHTPATDAAPMPLLYWAFPLLVWAAMRFGQRGAATLVLAISAFAISAAIARTGQFSAEPPEQRLAFLQLFLGVLTVTGGVLAALVEERSSLLAQEAAARSDAEAALRLRDEFLSIAAHELKTPLSPLKLQLGLLRRHIDQALPDLPKERELKRLFASSQARVDGIARLVDELLDVSRISQGRMRLHVEEFDLSELVTQLLETYKTELSATRCEPILRASPGLRVTWDPSRIEQLLVNLLTNAMKFGAGKPIELDIRKLDGRVALSVRDHGIGIAAEDRQRIFGLFERAVPSASFGGLGLGLFISKQIVELHGGTIRAESEPEVGSTFIVELPQDASAAESSPGERRGPTSTPRGRSLPWRRALEHHRDPLPHADA